MAKPEQTPTPMFHEPQPERGFPVTAASIAAIAVVCLLGLIVAMSRRKPEASVSNAAYIPSLEISNIQMSEADNPTGGKETYIEGHIVNHGALTVTGVTLQTMFGNDISMPPQVEAAPLRLVYTREPYVDTRAVGDMPLKPGADAEFRLTFEDVADNWNQQTPAIRVISVITR